MDSYIETLYKQFLQDPNSVEPQWQGYFNAIQQFDLAWQDENEEAVNMAATGTNGAVTSNVRPLKSISADFIPDDAEDAATAQSNVARLVQGYRYHGHKYANVNPIFKKEAGLDLTEFGVEENQLSETFATAGVLKEKHAPLKDIVQALESTYCGSLGVQLADITNLEERRWMRVKLEENQGKPNFSAEEKEEIYNSLMQANNFEKYLHTKFTGMKRFSIEGGDALIPMLRSLATQAADNGVKDIVFGMAHRGRLNVLVNILGKPLSEIFAAFAEKAKMADNSSSGDVKYHFGRSCDIETSNGNSIHLSLLNNPSHLEAVNPVVTGSTRAKQKRYGEDGIKKVIPLLIHGDSAFAGQGVVPETLNLANLSGYTVGGTIHVVINNQVGFTANPEETFSGDYCTDMARLLQCPILHVNGDDAEACVYAMQLAFEFRNLYHKDVVIDLVCYRRHGHNEGDDPTFTQPVMYKSVKGHKVPSELYKAALTEEGAVKEAALKKREETYAKDLADAFAEAEKGITIEIDTFHNTWEGFSKTSKNEPKTAISETTLANLSKAVATYPKGFQPNKKVAKMAEQRQSMLSGDEPINWGAAEVAAYGSLLNEGYSVRISGQDVQRGTFSHRHIGMVDGETGERAFPIATMADKEAILEVHNSCLSELAVLGFEYGHTLAAPRTLTVWEAQFGDFANGAQIMFDQFIASAEVKWSRMSGLVMLLPHGFEGQGPEHSSARLERFLQLSGDDNWTVAMPSTPAQIFHILRRQMHREFRKPLVIMSPKSLLRHPKAVASIEDLTKGEFQTVIPDTSVKEADVKRVVLCSGKVYYDLLNAREQNNKKDVALIRVEELYPAPVKAVEAELKKYKTDDIVWAQEEPRNQGAWTYLLDNLWPQLGIQTPIYAGRKASASPAVGSAKRHAEEQQELVSTALNLSK